MRVITFLKRGGVILLSLMTVGCLSTESGSQVLNIETVKAELKIRLPQYFDLINATAIRETEDQDQFVGVYEFSASPKVPTGILTDEGEGFLYVETYTDVSEKKDGVRGIAKIVGSKKGETWDFKYIVSYDDPAQFKYTPGDIFRLRTITEIESESNGRTVIKEDLDMSSFDKGKLVSPYYRERIEGRFQSVFPITSTYGNGQPLKVRGVRGGAFYSLRCQPDRERCVGHISDSRGRKIYTADVTSEVIYAKTGGLYMLGRLSIYHKQKGNGPNVFSDMGWHVRFISDDLLWVQSRDTYTLLKRVK